MSQKSITAICIDTLHHRLALSACQRMSALGFNQVILATDKGAGPHIDAFAENRQVDFRIDWIDKISSLDEYSHYLIYNLAQHVQTEHVLVFQWDGFIHNPALWWDGFLEYDYIGAPWPTPYSVGRRRVGNGGFSLRSRKLLEALEKLDMQLVGRPEDAFICIDAADDLENRFGIKFAPIEVAKYFSIEHYSLPPFDSKEEDVWREHTLGFHGWFNFHLAYTDAEILDLVDNMMSESERINVLLSWATTALLLNLYRLERNTAIFGLASRIGPLLGMLDTQNMTPRQIVEWLMERQHTLQSAG